MRSYTARRTGSLTPLTAAMLVLCLPQQYTNGQPPAAEVSAAEANAVLDRFLGHWQTHTQIHLAKPTPRDFDTRGRGHYQRTLDGRFVEFRTESTPPGDSDLQIMTYDREARVFRQWLFSSDGYTHEADGRWNPATSTLH